jgi:hypothetical protein
MAMWAAGSRGRLGEGLPPPPRGLTPPECLSARRRRDANPSFSAARQVSGPCSAIDGGAEVAAGLGRWGFADLFSTRCVLENPRAPQHENGLDKNCAGATRFGNRPVWGPFQLLNRTGYNPCQTGP